MFELVDLIIVFVLGFCAGLALIAWLVNRWATRLRAILEEALADTASAKEVSVDDLVAAGKVIPLKIEVDRDQYLCYNTLTNQFVCQGTNVEEIISRFKERFPGLNAALESGDEQALVTLRQQLKEHREKNAEA